MENRLPTICVELWCSAPELEAESLKMRPNSALASDACVPALRAFYSAAQRER
jgi:hypothetical protein